MKKSILIIDDDPNIIALLETFIKPLGYNILKANDGMTGLQMARDFQPSLIFLDIMLPKLDGYKISRFLKFDDNYRQIPVIMLTAKTDTHDEEIGKQTGADDYITKPFNKSIIIDTIHKYIK
ncbi:MAG: response regulator [Candidatus Marinimicrobia bacterium]|nr:response regulator [Candidatus Neomarinimicrobiota bacterium]